MEDLLRKAVESSLRQRIDAILDGKSAKLLDMPVRLNATLFQSQVFFDLLTELIKADAQGASLLLHDAVAMQRIIKAIDDGHRMKLSGAQFRHEQLEWARQEGDKIRVIWSFFERCSNEKSIFSHCTNLMLLRLCKANLTPDVHSDAGSRRSSPVAQSSPVLMASSSLNSLPDLPPSSDDEDSSRGEDAAPEATGALEAPPLADLPTPSAQEEAAPANVIAISDDENNGAEASPMHSCGVEAMLQARKYAAGPGFDTQQHKAAFRMMKKPSGVSNGKGAAKITAAAGAKRKRATDSHEEYEPSTGSLQPKDYPLSTSPRF